MNRPKKLVPVVPYDDHWPQLFDLERQNLDATFTLAASAIHHIGSTSVPGLCAKPVIDILVESPDLELVDAVTPKLEPRGYDARGEYGITGRRYFSRPPGPGLKVHVHAFRQGHRQIARLLRFRDFLREHPARVRSYCTLKMRLSTEHGDDADAYQDAKADFIGRLDTEAATWAKSHPAANRNSPNS